MVAERDGHEFIGPALANGAGAYLTGGPIEGGTAIVVDDTVRALQAAGRFARTKLPNPVFGITGSVGKTSVKDLLASILSERLVTAASAQSFNNELGVPLTLLNAADGTQAVVVEMGARGVGHIAHLCDIAHPSVGIVTRVAAVHTSEFGSIEEVARAKGELVEALPARGIAILNAEDPRVAAMARRTSATVITFGEGGDVQAEDLTMDDDLRPTFVLASPWERAQVTLMVRGRHQVENALAAAAAGLAEGIGAAAVVRGLERGSLSRWRMELVAAPSGAVVLNDAYNANPTSVAAALDSLGVAAGPTAHRRAGRDGRARRSNGGRSRGDRRAGRRSSASGSSPWTRPTTAARTSPPSKGRSTRSAPSAPATPSSSRAAGSPASNASPSALLNP